MAMTESQKRAQAKYNREKTTSLYIKMNNNTETDMIAWVKRQPNKNGYVKALIREDMKRHGV